MHLFISLSQIRLERYFWPWTWTLLAHFCVSYPHWALHMMLIILVVKDCLVIGTRGFEYQSKWNEVSIGVSPLVEICPCFLLVYSFEYSLKHISIFSLKKMVSIICISKKSTNYNFDTYALYKLDNTIL